jgi:hypothetical protein
MLCNDDDVDVDDNDNDVDDNSSGNDKDGGRGNVQSRWLCRTITAAAFDIR